MTNQECESMFLEAGYHEAIPGIFLCAGWAQGGKDSCEVGTWEVSIHKHMKTENLSLIFF